MIKNKLIAFLFFFTVLNACSFPYTDDIDIKLLRHAKDTLGLGIYDSFYIIKKYKAVDKGDTLFIKIISIYSPSADDTSPPIRIPINPGIKFVKLQNDKVFDVDSIPYFGWVKLPK